MEHQKDSLRVAEIAVAFGELLDLSAEQVSVDRGGARATDLVLSALGERFALEWSGSATVGPLATKLKTATERAKALGRRAVPVVVVPYMGETGARVCHQAGVSWLDLSGNAHIIAKGLRAIVRGRPNRFRRPGRPASVFAPMSSRVARWLLIHPGRAFTQREIARSTAMNEGFVSRIVARLEIDGYAFREWDGSVRAKDPGLLLDAWRETYELSKHVIIQGHIAARSGDALTRFISDTLVSAKLGHAATGLAAAWQMIHFSAFRVASFFVTSAPSDELKARLGFRDEARGANVWFIVPNDVGVFYGAQDREGMRCVHPVQAYLDLKDHPERAAEAAARLRTELMNWKRDE